MSEKCDSVESGCNWGCGVAIGALIALTFFSSCARDIAYNIERGRQEAITKGEQERLELHKSTDAEKK